MLKLNQSVRSSPKDFSSCWGADLIIKSPDYCSRELERIDADPGYLPDPECLIELEMESLRPERNTPQSRSQLEKREAQNRPLHQ
jgi:hypothetical protein